MKVGFYLSIPSTDLLLLLPFRFSMREFKEAEFTRLLLWLLMR